MKATKVFAIVLVLMLLCSTLCACGTDTEPSPTANPAQTTTTATAELTTEPTTEPATEPSTEPAPDAIDIKTTGGVVLVGQILLDEDGWYFQPEQPLNITFEYFIGELTDYPEQTRIRMFDPQIDNFEKSQYLGQTVTASGTFTYYRDDFETLYFMPYTVTRGKTVECSYADPSIGIPDGPVNLYDPDIPLPDAMDPTVSDGQYRYNPYMLSLEALEYMGNDFADFYVDFVDAFLHYQREVQCSSRDYAQILYDIICYEFPLYHACAEPYEYLQDYDSATGTLTINYKYDRETFDSIVSEFMASANDMLANTSPDFSDEENARNIYHAICTRMTYDYSALEDLERKESYYAYLDHTGVCITFANVYNQLLTRVGVRTSLAYCDGNYNDDIGHVWSIVTLHGQQYFCDPTYELAYDGGSGYRFFGMNYADRTADGTGANGIWYGNHHMLWLDPGMIAEQSLNK